jgi:hypothetical protein
MTRCVCLGWPRALYEKGTGPNASFNNPLGLQIPERSSSGRSRNAEPTHKLCLARETLGRVIVALSNFCNQRTINFVMFVGDFHEDTGKR